MPHATFFETACVLPHRNVRRKPIPRCKYLEFTTGWRENLLTEIRAVARGKIHPIEFSGTIFSERYGSWYTRSRCLLWFARFITGISNLWRIHCSLALKRNTFPHTN